MVALRRTRLTFSPDNGGRSIRWVSPKTLKHRFAIAALARTALASAPSNPSLHLALAQALIGAGKLDEAASVLSDALARLPDHEAFHQELAHVLARRGEIDAALFSARGRNAPWAPVFLFKLLTRQGRREEAEVYEAGVVASSPADPDLFAARVKRWRGDPEKILLHCDTVLSKDDGAAHALYHKSLALAQLGRVAEAEALMGLDRFLRIAPLPAPSGFGGDEAFREAVRGEILANPSLHGDPAGHATRSGLRTGIYPADGDRASPALVEAIRSAIEAYVARLSGDHPFARGVPARARLTQWALIFKCEGHQVPHHHPGSWLTGVYYVSARRDAHEPQAEYPGKIRLGGFPECRGGPPWPVLEVEPIPGTLLLFPSYVPHETIAPGEGAERISVAFDVAAA